MHHMRRQGIQWEWFHGCKGILEGWSADWQWLRIQAQEQQARHSLEQEAHSRQETYSRYDLARQWYVGQRRFQSIARGLVGPVWEKFLWGGH